MRLPWPASEYERTCTDCGYTWRVPRQFARKGIVPIYGATSGVRGLANSTAAGADLQAGMAIAEQAATFRVCGECGSERFSQRPVRS